MSGPACLLVHGFGGTPFEMESVAEALRRRGLSVTIPTLPGHASTLEQWSATRWGDWLSHLGDVYRRLQAEHGRVGLVGFSMGGCLCLALAQQFRPEKLVTIAAPVYLYRLLPPDASDWRLPLTGLLMRFRPLWPSAPQKPDSRRIAPWQGYEEATALKPLYSFLLGMRVVRRNLQRVEAPLLAIHSPCDRKVPFGNLQEIISKVSSPVRHKLVLSISERITSHHMLTTHQETKDAVALAVAEFVCGPSV